MQIRGVEGKVWLVPRSGAKRGDEGAVVIVLPADKFPGKPLPIAGLRPGDPPPAEGDATLAALAELGGTAKRADASGDFAFSVPAAGSYRILVISRKATREPNGPLEQSDIRNLENTSRRLPIFWGVAVIVCGQRTSAAASGRSTRSLTSRIRNAAVCYRVL